jgi:hypothetical protein
VYNGSHCQQQLSGFAAVDPASGRILCSAHARAPDKPLQPESEYFKHGTT